MRRVPQTPRPPTVVIQVSGGCAQMIRKPKGVRVQIRDYDIEGCEADGERIKLDKDGDSYHLMEWE